MTGHPDENRTLADIARAAGVTRERVRQLVETADITGGNCVHEGMSTSECTRCTARITLRQMGYFGRTEDQ